MTPDRVVLIGALIGVLIGVAVGVFMTWDQLSLGDSANIGGVVEVAIAWAVFGALVGASATRFLRL
jgi:hypothetical protein